MTIVMNSDWKLYCSLYSTVCKRGWMEAWSHVHNSKSIAIKQVFRPSGDTQPGNLAGSVEEEAALSDGAFVECDLNLG